MICWSRWVIGSLSSFRRLILVSMNGSSCNSSRLRRVKKAWRGLKKRNRWLHHRVIGKWDWVRIMLNRIGFSQPARDMRRRTESIQPAKEEGKPPAKEAMRATAARDNKATKEPTRNRPSRRKGSASPSPPRISTPSSKKRHQKWRTQ